MFIAIPSSARRVLQDVFGYINDVCMAPRLIEIQQERQAAKRRGAPQATRLAIMTPRPHMFGAGQARPGGNSSARHGFGRSA
jgi:hypothetical protein